MQPITDFCHWTMRISDSKREKPSELLWTGQKKEKAEISFRDAIYEGMNLENELPKGWLKDYKKKNDKAVKKGKTPVNEAQNGEYFEEI